MFSKKPEQNSPNTPTRPVASSGSTFSVIGADVTISGDIQASADLHVDGTIEGDLTCASLVQGEGSVIRGAIHAESAKLAGQVDGTIEVSQLIVTKTARIHGDVSYDNVTVEQGAEIDGRLSSKSATTASEQSDEPVQDNGDQTKLSLAG